MNSSEGADPIVKTGEVTEALPGLKFRVVLEEDGREILGYLAGKLRLHRIRVLPGDTVQIEMTSPQDDKGRIVYRGTKR